MNEQQTFEAAYWAHQPPEVQALQNIPDLAARQAAALQLATKGYAIDVPIAAWGWSAFLVMTQRVNYGYTWVPSALMPNIQLAPGLTAPGAIPYDAANPPAGAIKVSLDLADYPPYNPPAPLPTPPAPPTSLVGIDMGAGYFQAFHAAIGQLKDGQEYDSDPRGKFVFHFRENPFNPGSGVAWFEKS